MRIATGQARDAGQTDPEDSVEVWAFPAGSVLGPEWWHGHRGVGGEIGQGGGSGFEDGVDDLVAGDGLAVGGGAGFELDG